MLKSRFLRKILKPGFESIDQVRLLYILSLIVGLLSALAAAFLKNTIHYTHHILTQGITRESGNFLYLVYPLTGMLLTIMYVRF